MFARRPRRLVIALSIGGVLLAAGGWFAHRETACARLVEEAKGFPDAQVRRGRDGACRMCRDEGWLYDIAFDRCSAADRIYAGVRVP